MTMHYITIDIQKVKDSNPRPCTTPTLTTKRQRFEPMTVHYTTNDPQKSKIRTHKPTMHYAPPFTPKNYKIRTQDHRSPVTSKSKRFEPKTMHYTTIDPQKDQIRTQNDALPGMKATLFRWISRTVLRTAKQQNSLQGRIQ
jgi:hypothetical protein